jgi:hypothetical protein
LKNIEKVPSPLVVRMGYGQTVKKNSPLPNGTEPKQVNRVSAPTT